MTKDWGLLDVPLKSLQLPHCWVCENKFTEFGGKPNFFKHEHHIVPRAFGGLDGPTVSLCDSHHTAGHQIALRLEKGKPYTDLISGVEKQDKRLLWMATVICNAKTVTQNDPNKAIPITFLARGETKKKIKQLRTVYNSSMANILEVAVDTLYARHFQVDRNPHRQSRQQVGRNTSASKNGRQK